VNVAHAAIAYKKAKQKSLQKINLSFFSFLVFVILNVTA
jgi:hypothetical protein